MPEINQVSLYLHPINPKIVPPSSSVKPSSDHWDKRTRKSSFLPFPSLPFPISLPLPLPISILPVHYFNHYIYTLPLQPNNHHYYYSSEDMSTPLSSPTPIHLVSPPSSSPSLPLAMKQQGLPPSIQLLPL